MTPLNTLALTILVVCAAVCRVEAFTTTITATTTTSAAITSCALQAGRRDFLDAAVSATAGLVIASIPAVARAEEEQITDDLAMPSEEEQKKADVSLLWLIVVHKYMVLCYQIRETTGSSASCCCCCCSCFDGVIAPRPLPVNSTFAEKYGNTFLSPPGFFALAFLQVGIYYLGPPEKAERPHPVC
jgi:hypothetical protein